MKEITVFLLIIHGMIHLFGFAKGFDIKELDLFTKDVTRTEGLVWLATSTLLIFSAIILLIGLYWWIYVALISLLISQALIVKHWFDARMGTIVNVIILIVIVMGGGLK